ncbi:MAG: hypothetical protein H6538_08105 [Bacteroidales bacterium]|nr:hypothetical protein [Bacteroidales bacterium]MCB9000143.1 hypothetical protein [Bacteroidales bacterium]MCB9013500.1 hypothetical protein [Bacteroidales bacterium]
MITLRIRFIYFLLVSSAMLFTSCRHNDDISQLPEVCFTTDVLPIFQSGCAISGCHDGSGAGGLNLSSYNGIMQGVTPGDAMKSRVYTVLSNVWNPEGFMPPDRPLSLENRSKIKVWIEQGALETTCP